VCHNILANPPNPPSPSRCDMSTGGSLATLIALRREKVQITAWEFFKIAVIAMPLALIASLLFLWN
jgi:arsenical pump membrane protein